MSELRRPAFHTFHHKDLMKHILGSLLIFLCFGFFGLQTVWASPSSPDYGESIPWWPSTWVYALGGTLSSNELGSIYISATWSSRWLFYDKNSYTLTGSIYSTSIGLIEVTSISNPSFVSGIKVCNGQDLASIIGDCIITWSWWSSSISLYSPAIGILTESVAGTVDFSTKKIKNLDFSNIGFWAPILSLSGINLVPKATNLTWWDFSTGVYYITNSGQIDVYNDGTITGIGKSLKITPNTLSGNVDAILTKVYQTNMLSFTGVDLSIPWDYRYELTIDGVISRWNIKVIAGKVSTTLTGGTSTNFLYKYCSDNWSSSTYHDTKICPESTSFIASTVTYEVATKKANDKDPNKITLLMRDEYGNRISYIPLYLEIDITRKLTDGELLQTNIPIELSGWISTGSPGFSGLRIPQTDWSGTTSMTTITKTNYNALTDYDLAIQLFSTTPWKLKTEWSVTTKNLIAGGTPWTTVSALQTWDIKFEWLIQNKNSWNSLKISPTGNILRNRESIFSHEYTISDSGSISTPHLKYIITMWSGEIVDRIRSVWVNTCEGYTNTGGTSVPAGDCGFRNNSWWIATTVNNTLFWADIPKTNSGTIDIGLTFATGAMTSTGTNTGYLIVMASYNVGWDKITYPLINQPFKTEEFGGTIPLKILGQIGSSDLGTSMKSLDLLSSNLINTERDKIRKQAQMMRQNFVSHPLVINNMATDIPNQVYIVEWDIYINADIWPPVAPKPKVLIALKNPSTGAGGNIYIKDTVKDIAASLIADGSIFGWDGTAIKPEWVNQLYIRGSIMSNNTIGWAWLSRCPRNTTTCTPTTAINYDFEKIRKLDTGAGWSTTSNAPDASTSFIIEHDPRLVQDSPLVLMRDLTR